VNAASPALRPPRLIKVFETFYEYLPGAPQPELVRTPFILLHGHWLTGAGFHAGQLADIHVKDRIITLSTRKLPQL
ncbi:MAG TPA: hypothetical protein VEC06_11900, partial [Paucimonas sp.]|nr:hypothetical protein [Paucimonas sp.]